MAPKQGVFLRFFLEKLHFGTHLACFANGENVLEHRNHPTRIKLCWTDQTSETKTNCFMAYVRNANGTSRWSSPSTGEPTWLDYWKNHRNGTSMVKCGSCGATSNLVGAHVQKVNGGDELYITPLCRSCNQKDGNFWVDTELVRVPSGI